jgi:hypothetical protein
MACFEESKKLRLSEEMKEKRRFIREVNDNAGYN